MENENYVEMTERHKRERAARHPRYRSLLNWWTITPEERDSELSGYNSFFAARKIAVLMIAVFFLLGLRSYGFDEDGNFDIGFMIEAVTALILGIFTWQGHRWAILGMMLLWTIDKAAQGYQLASAPTHHSLLPIVIWWTILMAPLWRAFKTEQIRNAPLEQ